MKTSLLKLAALILMFGCIASCSVQKRRYNKGWHVDWAGHSTSARKNNVPAPAPVKAYQPQAAELAQTVALKSEAKSGQQAPVITAEAPKTAPSQAASEQASGSREAAGKSMATAGNARFKPIDTSRRMNDSLDDGTDALGMLSFIFALVGLVTGLGFLLALIFGAVALDRYRAGRGTPSRKIFAQLGYLIGLIGIIVFLIVLLLLLALVW